jgi:hypothetical protein
MSTKYRCYLLALNRIATVQVIEGNDDAAAQLEASKILEESRFTAAELWDGARMVCTISRTELCGLNLSEPDGIMTGKK